MASRLRVAIVSVALLGTILGVALYYFPTNPLVPMKVDTSVVVCSDAVAQSINPYGSLSYQCTVQKGDWLILSLAAKSSASLYLGLQTQASSSLTIFNSTANCGGLTRSCFSMELPLLQNGTLRVQIRNLVSTLNAASGTFTTNRQVSEVVYLLEHTTPYRRYGIVLAAVSGVVLLVSVWDPRNFLERRGGRSEQATNEAMPQDVAV